MRALLAVLALLAASGAAAAGSADAPEATDAAGDAGPMENAAPVGFQDVDIVAAWFEGETEDTIELVMAMAGPVVDRMSTIWGQAFEVNGTHKAAGTAYFGQRYFFVCDYVGDLNAQNCVPVDGAVEGPLVRLRLPRANLSEPVAGHTLTITEGVTFGAVGVPIEGAVTTTVIYDRSPAGVPYVLALGGPEIVPPIAVADEAIVNATGPGRASSTSSAPSETPSAGAALLLAAVGSVAFLIGRRR